MSGIWIVEFRRRYIKGDRYTPDYVLQRKGRETNRSYAQRAIDHIESRNHRGINFQYRARKFVPAPPISERSAGE